MKIRDWLALGILIALGGCATKSEQNPHVLSGEAPVDEVIAKADESFAAGDFQAAAILYQIAIGQDPQAETWFRLGLTNAAQRMPSQSVYSYQQALILNRDHSGALEKLALHHVAKSEVDEASKYLHELLRVAPDNWKAHNGLGVVADLQKEFGAAREHYLNALKLRPDLALLWNNLGYSVYLIGELDQAAEYMARALMLEPGNKPALLNLALVRVRQERYADALAILSKDDDLAGAYTNLGILSYRVENFEKAEHFLSEAIVQSPTYNGIAHDYLALSRKAAERTSIHPGIAESPPEQTQFDPR